MPPDARAAGIRRVNSSLDHLPEGKRADLARILAILFSEFEDAIKGRMAPTRKQGRILKVVLYGSYARGDWVDDPVGGYKSDYDLLVVVNHEELTDVPEYWVKPDEHLLQAYQITHQLSAPAHFIVHSLADVNRQLTRGRPFFVDIVRDGIALYDAPDHPFAQPERLSPEVAHKEAQANFNQWFDSAGRFLVNAQDNIGRGWGKEAAFLLHQATERFYHCALLTLTLYSPKSHKLNFLRSQAERVAPELIPVWPRDTRSAQRCWELLRRAYVEARYSTHYKITAQELAWLSERVAELQRRVEASCREYLAATGPSRRKT
jgi:predicted nucleotidyltransferase/HEPN domain-containing protein